MATTVTDAAPDGGRSAPNVRAERRAGLPTATVAFGAFGKEGDRAAGAFFFVLLRTLRPIWLSGSWIFLVCVVGFVWYLWYVADTLVSIVVPLGGSR